MRKRCPICKGNFDYNREYITYTSNQSCPEKFLGRMIHWECAKEQGYPILEKNVEKINTFR